VEIDRHTRKEQKWQKTKKTINVTGAGNQYLGVPGSPEVKGNTQPPEVLL